MIMGWENVYSLQMRPPSTKESVVNVIKFRSNKEEIDSNIETGGERIESSLDIEGDRIEYNVDIKENGTKKYLHSVETNEKGQEIHKAYAYIVRR